MLLRVHSFLSGEQGEKQYEVKRFVGNGMNGEVYEVFDHNDKSPKAVKVSSDALMLEREAEAAKRIIHPNVVRYFEYREAIIDGSVVHYIIMEYVPDGDMRGRINKRLESGELFTLDLLLGWMSQLASGLSAINEVLIHRDLKPENILFEKDTPKISDFGLSKYVEEATRAQTYKGEGTYPYMAPETWELKRQSIQTDIYSLGIIFYELATLQLPFKAQNWLAWSQEHRFAVIPHAQAKNSDLSYVLDGMIQKMMDKEPSGRYQSSEEVLNILREYSEQSEGKQLFRVPDSLVEIARQKRDIKSDTEHVKKLEAERNRELGERALYSFREFMSILDKYVSEVNHKLQTIIIEKSVEGFLPLRRYLYTYYEKSLVLDFLSIPDLDKSEEGKDLNFIESKGIIGVACLYIKEQELRKVGFWQVESLMPIIREGKSFLLVLEGDTSYGRWKTYDTKKKSIFKDNREYEQLGAHWYTSDLWRDLRKHWKNLKGFREDDFLQFLKMLVA